MKVCFNNKLYGNCYLYGQSQIIPNVFYGARAMIHPGTPLLNIQICKQILHYFMRSSNKRTFSMQSGIDTYVRNVTWFTLLALQMYMTCFGIKPSCIFNN